VPHCAVGSFESTTGFESLYIENIESFFSTERSITSVSPEAQKQVEVLDNNNAIREGN
jgi:hypothetical protein